MYARSTHTHMWKNKIYFHHAHTSAHLKCVYTNLVLSLSCNFYSFLEWKKEILLVFFFHLKDFDFFAVEIYRFPTLLVFCFFFNKHSIFVRFPQIRSITIQRVSFILHTQHTLTSYEERKNREKEIERYFSHTNFIFI